MHRLLFVLLLLSCVACRARQVDGAIPAPVYVASGAVHDAPYRILPGDLLEIRFFHTPDLDVTLPVRPDGRISLPFASGLKASGMTPEALAAELERRYADQLRDPVIAVLVQGFAGHKVHVGGQVASPGVLELTARTTVFDAVLQAGGLLDNAHAEQVIVIRQVPLAVTETVAARTVAHVPPAPSPHIAIVVDLDALVYESDHAQNIPLLPGDAVFVPRSAIGNVNRWVDLYVRRNLPFSISYGARADLN